MQDPRAGNQQQQQQQNISASLIASRSHQGLCLCHYLS